MPSGDPASKTHRARKRFGQHFLEAVWVDKVIRALDPQPDDTFIEIGPGHGALTRPLAARVSHVAAYEIDRDLAGELRSAAIPKVTIVEGDFLNAAPETPARPAAPGALRVAGNLPYNVASPIMIALLDWSRRGVPLVDATLMLQLEVADRLAAEPGTKDYGALTVLIRHRASVERLLTLPPGAFRPPPKVRSALVRLRFHPPDPPVADEPQFARFVQAVFARRRKTLANADPHVWGRGRIPVRLLLEGAGLDGRRRAETLSIAEFVRLAEAVRNNT